MVGQHTATENNMLAGFVGLSCGHQDKPEVVVGESGLDKSGKGLTVGRASDPNWVLSRSAPLIGGDLN
jgi:hypothetical protein